jgi:hypothetical protein
MVSEELVDDNSCANNHKRREGLERSGEEPFPSRIEAKERKRSVFTGRTLS